MFLALPLVLFLLKMSGLNSVASETAIKQLLFLGRLITEPNMAPTVINLFQCRAESYFDTTVTSAGVKFSISEALVKHDLFHHFESWYNSSTFPIYENWKRIVRDRIQVFENDAWLQLCDNHKTSILFRPVLKIYLPQIFGPQLMNIQT